MKLPVTYVWTHDSIGLGEDGPTHQPIEHLAALRAIPGPGRRPPGRRQRDRGRLADRSSSTPTGPAGLRLTRQNVPVFPRGEDGFADTDGVRQRRLRPASTPPTAQPEVDPHRHRLRGAARRRGPRAARGRGHPRPGSSRCRAASGSTSRTTAYRETVLPPTVQGPGQRRGRHRAGLARLVGDHGRDRLARALRRLAPTTHGSTAVRLHRRGRGRRPPRTASRSRPADHRHRPPATRPTTRRNTMTDRLQELSRRRGGHLARRPVPRAPRARGNLAELDRGHARRRRHHQPDDLRRGARRRRRLRRAGARPRRRAASTSTRRSSQLTTTTSATPATCCGRSTTPPTASTAGSRSRSTRGLAHDTDGDRRRGQGSCGGGRPAEPVHQDPGDRRRACPAITAALAEGISVNVTLIFGLERYRGGHGRLPRRPGAGARRAGHDLSEIDSVASFFVSRVDTEIDKRLDAIGTDEAKALKGKAGVANARLAYQAYEEVFAADRWQALGRRRRQRRSGRCGPRPASRTRTTPTRCTSIELVAPDTVNTMPETTLEAFADHGEVRGDTVTGRLRRGPAGHRRPRPTSASTTTT